MTMLLISKILNQSITTTFTVKDMDDVLPILHIPTVLYKAPAATKDLTCRFKTRHAPFNCISHKIKSVKKNKDTIQSKLDELIETSNSTGLICSNPKCINKVGNTSVATGLKFHAGCYCAMINRESNKEHITKFKYKPTDITTLHQEVCFPVCSPGCWRSVNSIVNSHKAKVEKAEARASSIMLQLILIICHCCCLGMKIGLYLMVQCHYQYYSNGSVPKRMDLHILALKIVVQTGQGVLQKTLIMY